jgi:regulator of protease activity HflC (stomatin/prohibitin superfamily)
MKPPGSDLSAAIGPQNIGAIIKAQGQREDLKAQQDRQDSLIKQILASPPQATNKNLLASQRFLQNQMPSLSSLDIPKLRT